MLKPGRLTPFVMALVVGWLALAPAPAWAHSIVKATEPGIDAVVHEAPKRVVMIFNEPVEVAFGAIRVFDTRGRRVDDGKAAHLPGRPDTVRVALRPNVADGTYVVAWRIVSADGHPIQEAFLFHVGHPGEPPEGLVAGILSSQSRSGPVEGILFGVARWVNFAGLLLLAGSVVFLALVWRRPRASLALRSPEVEGRFGRRWRRAVSWSWLTVVVATVVSFVLQGAVGGGVSLPEALSPGILGEVLRTRFGLVAVAKMGLLLVAAAFWVSVQRTSRVPLLSDRPATEARSLAAAALQPAIPRTILWVGVLLTVALLATPGLAGHAGNTRPIPLNIVTDTLHVLAASVWMGGLVMLLAAAFPATRELEDGERLRVMAPVVARFSDMALIAVAVLVATGIYRSWVEVRALRALTEASYGLVLLAKLATFLPILALGAINNRWTKPRIHQAAQHDEASPRPLATLRRLVALEVALGVVVLGVTAFLVNLPPARVEAGVEGPFMTETMLGDQHLAVGVDPNQVGTNMVHLSLTTEEGLPGKAEEIRVLFRMPSENIGPIEAMAESRGHGTFVVHGHQLSVPGEWTLEIVALIDRFTEERATVEIVVNP